MSMATVQPVSTPFADARADQLRFSLTAPPHAALARTTAVLDVPGVSDGPPAPLTVDLAILGTSHQVTVSDADGTVLVRETLACLDAEPVHPVPTHQRTALPGGVHTFRHTVVRSQDVDTAAEAALTHAASLPVSCAAGFPGDPHALTVLACDTTAEGLRWRTWHCYPQAAEVVETQTVFSPDAVPGAPAGASAHAPEDTHAPEEGVR